MSYFICILAELIKSMELFWSDISEKKNMLRSFLSMTEMFLAALIIIREKKEHKQKKPTKTTLK